ncbi:uncharacterized protein LOC111086434 isoform X2 [Limulus polyphemus]|uniref:Uncharacterized protein LOC111086434 isoform X2 n=1 Tax=Limulus polyphemus TaxID=6850 RepID=A0ABM1SMU9_LIMPO|nr:uncharacterized protein LOC111086434 isoform X2 [Limulus polyphemus]
MPAYRQYTGEEDEVIQPWRHRLVRLSSSQRPEDEGLLKVYIQVLVAASPRIHGTSDKSDLHFQLIAEDTIVFRCYSRTHKYAFTVSKHHKPLLHLAGSSESESQTWMATLRASLWPPTPISVLEAALSTKFEVSVIDDEYVHRAGLLGAFGYLAITDKKLVLTNPKTGDVIQEWYFNTLCRFALLDQEQEDDTGKIFSIDMSKESSTGSGRMFFYSTQGREILQKANKIIQQLLEGSVTEKTKDSQDLQGIVQTWEAEDYYKRPNPETRSILDCPNFIFNKSLTLTDHTFKENNLRIHSKPRPNTLSWASLSTHSDSGISGCSDPLCWSLSSNHTTGQSFPEIMNCSLTSLLSEHYDNEDYSSDSSSISSISATPEESLHESSEAVLMKNVFHDSKATNSQLGIADLLGKKLQNPKNFQYENSKTKMKITDPTYNLNTNVQNTPSTEKNKVYCELNRQRSYENIFLNHYSYSFPSNELQGALSESSLEENQSFLTLSAFADPDWSRRTSLASQSSHTYAEVGSGLSSKRPSIAKEGIYEDIDEFREELFNRLSGKDNADIEKPPLPPKVISRNECSTTGYKISFCQEIIVPESICGNSSKTEVEETMMNATVPKCNILPKLWQIERKQKYPTSTKIKLDTHKKREGTSDRNGKSNNHHLEEDSFRWLSFKNHSSEGNIISAVEKCQCNILQFSTLPSYNSLHASDNCNLQQAQKRELCKENSWPIYSHLRFNTSPEVQQIQSVPSLLSELDCLEPKHKDLGKFLQNQNGLFCKTLSNNVYKHMLDKNSSEAFTETQSNILHNLPIVKMNQLLSSPESPDEPNGGFSNYSSLVANQEDYCYMLPLVEVYKVTHLSTAKSKHTNSWSNSKLQNEPHENGYVEMK